VSARPAFVALSRGAAQSDGAPARPAASIVGAAGRRAALTALGTTLAACALPGTAPDARAAARASLAPSGTLRAAINFGNPILANRDPATRRPVGVSVDLARELGRELGVAVELLPFEAAGRVTDALASNAWDVAFLAVDPVRGREIAYSAPYVVIEGAYGVAQGSPIVANGDVDRPGTRVVVARGSAYDLHLTRSLRFAALVRVPTSQQVTDAMFAQGLEVAAGVRQQLESDRRRHPSMRLLPGRFMVIEQAIGTPIARADGARYLADFAERMKASGFVAQALARHRIEGAAVAPPR